MPQILGFSGQAFALDKLNDLTGNYLSGNLRASSWGLRTCLNAVSGSCTAGWHWAPAGTLWAGFLSASSAGVLTPLALKAKIGADDLANLGVGQVQNVLTAVISDGSGMASLLTLTLDLWNDSGTKKLLLTYTMGETSYSQTYSGLADDTFYTVKIHAYLDKAKWWVDNAEQTDTTAFAVPYTGRLTLYSLIMSFDTDASHATVYVDCIYAGIDEVSYSTTLGVSRTNGNPDNGVLYFIDDVNLAAVIAAGAIVARTITDGVFTEALADGNWLEFKYLTGNEGPSKKLTKTAGEWTESEW